MLLDHEVEHGCDLWVAMDVWMRELAETWGGD